MSENEKSGLDSFLTDESEMEEGVEYIKPDIELKLPPNKRKECREIVREIKNFGVTGQRQLLYLIYLLALEIEDQNIMKELVAVIKKGRKELEDEKKLILSDE